MKRSTFIEGVAIGTIGTALPGGLLAGSRNQETLKSQFYIGCYTESSLEGIGLCSFDLQTGSILLNKVIGNIANPSFLVQDRSGKYLYAVNETGDFNGQSSGSVSAFRIDGKTGELTLLNAKPSRGAHPCHLTTDRTGRYLLVANYTGGNVAVLPVNDDGSLGDPTDLVQHTGHGPNLSRQEAAHAHSITLSPDNRFAFACDLGIDQIVIYRFDEKTGKLTPSKPGSFKTAPGAGPRHFAFSGNGKSAFVVNELNSTLTYLAYNPETGELKELSTVTTLPEGFTGENTCADVHVHPNGRFVYASNRGHDSISVFAIQEEQREIRLVQTISSGGRTPRNFAIHPSGRYLLAANQNSHTVQAFSIDPDSGKIIPKGESLHFQRPVCIAFKL